MKIDRVLMSFCTLALLAGCGNKPPDFYSGYAEADYVHLASPIAGTLTKLYLKRGDKAVQGAPAFVLEQESERAAREDATSHLQRAQAQLADLKKGKRPDEIAAANAQLAQAQAALQLSSADLARQQKLVTAKFISPAQLDAARAAVGSDKAHVNELQAQLRVTQLGARSDEIKAAEQDVKSAAAQLAEAEWKVDQKTLHIPVLSDVVDVLYQEGELVAAGGPVLTLLPPQNIKARFFVPEAALGALQIGQDISLRCDGCGPAIPAKISFLSPTAEYTAPLIYSKENRSTLVFMIEARPSPEDARRLHPGQPLEIRLGNTGAQKNP
jgi:HlyD family secretion protein